MLVPRLAVAVLVVLGSAACSNSTDTAVVSTPTGVSSSTQPGTSTPSPSASPTIDALAESVLAPIPGLKYESVPGSGSDAEQAQTFLKAAANPEAAASLVSGFLSRTLTYQGHLVGGVQAVRVRQTLTAAEQDDVLRTFLAEFSQGTPVPSKVGGVRVWEVDAARGTKVGAVEWMSDNDIVIAWSSGVADARKIAAAYIKAS